MTSVSCVLEGISPDNGQVRSAIINKQPAYVSLADIKLLPELQLEDHRDGVFMAKTPDVEGSHHWSVIVNDQDVVPCCDDGSIAMRVKATYQASTKFTYQIEGSYEAQPHTCVLNKAATGITLRDILAVYKGNPGIFFFKEYDASGAHNWTIASRDEDVVPSFDGQIIGKVRLFPQKKEGQWTVISYQMEGVTHPTTTRIPKAVSQVTVQDVRNGFASIHNFLPGDMYIRVGNQYLSVTEPEVGNGPLYSVHSLIQIRVRAYAPQLALAPLQAANGNAEPYSLPVFDTPMLPASNIHPTSGQNLPALHQLTIPQHGHQSTQLHSIPQQAHSQQLQHQPIQQHSTTLPQLSQLHHYNTMQQQHPQIQQHQLQYQPQHIPQQQQQQQQIQLQQQLQQRQLELQQHQLQLQQQFHMQHPQMQHLQQYQPQQSQQNQLLPPDTDMDQPAQSQEQTQEYQHGLHSQEIAEQSAQEQSQDLLHQQLQGQNEASTAQEILLSDQQDDETPDQSPQ